MQQNHRRPVARRQVMQTESVDNGSARINHWRGGGFYLFSRRATNKCHQEDTKTASPSTCHCSSKTLSERFHAAAWLARLKNANRSALIWSALVVGMPCGNPGYTLSVAFFTIFADI